MKTTHQRLIKGTDVLGLKVISIEEGKELSSVNDIIYDPELNKVTALLIDKGGWFSDARVVPIEDVESIGEDAVIIQAADLIRPASSISKRIANIASQDLNLTKTRIITDKGTDLGTISDIYFDTKGIVEEFEVSQGMFKSVQSGKKRIRVSDIVTIGVDATIVRDDTKVVLEQQAQQQGLQGAVNTVGAKTEEVVETVKEKTEEMGTKAKYKAQEIQQDPQTQSGIQNVLQKNDEIMHSIEEKTEQLKEGIVSFWQQVQRDPDLQESAANMRAATTEATRTGKKTLNDQVYRAKQTAKEKTGQVRADMEAKDDSEYTNYSSQDEYTPPSYAGMKGGQSKRKEKTTRSST